jgi:hypothetical protein
MFFRAFAPCLACVAVLGCSEASDYSVVPSWAINGLAPSDDDCAAFGVDHVEFRLTRPKVARVLTAQCSESIQYDDGQQMFELGGFVTGGHFEFGRTYSYELSLVDKNGRPVHGATQSGNFQVYADDSTPWLLEPLEIFEPQGDVASWSGAWTVEGASLEQGCQNLGIDHVTLFITTDFDLDLTHEIPLGPDTPCAQGSVKSDMPELTYGRYLVRYVAFDARNAVVDQSDYIVADVDRPGELAFDTVRFDGVIENTSDAGTNQ